MEMQMNTQKLMDLMNDEHKLFDQHEGRFSEFV